MNTRRTSSSPRTALRLTLVRHAKSDWDNRELSDFERPLNARGTRDAPRMAQRFLAGLEREGVERVSIVSSPAVRALTTARAFAETLGVADPAIRLEPRIYEATPGTLLEVVRGFDDRQSFVLMFGHNPGFSDFARLLAECPFSEMPTCAAAHLRLDTGSWKEVNPGIGELLRYDFPKQVE